jgi:hypothetical protein
VNGKHGKGKVNGKDTVGDAGLIAVSLVQDDVMLAKLGNESEDVKPEDIGTPLTSLTSWQSLPMDELDHKFMNGKRGGRKTETPGLGEGVIDVDADADGEYEEDVEGEVDVS